MAFLKVIQILKKFLRKTLNANKFTLVPILKHLFLWIWGAMYNILWRILSAIIPRGSSNSSRENDFCLIKKPRKSLIYHLSSEISVMCYWCEEKNNASPSVKVLSFNEFPFWNICIKLLCFKLTTYQKTKHRCLQPTGNFCFISPQS